MVKKQVVTVDGDGVVTPTASTPGVPTSYTHQKVTGACLACKKAHHACDQERPKCARCVRLGSECEYRVHRKPGRKRLHAQAETSSSSSPSSSPSCSPQKRRKVYSEDKTVNSPTTSTRTTTPEHFLSVDAMKNGLARLGPARAARVVDGDATYIDEQYAPIPNRLAPSAPELLVTMLRAQQQQQQHNQHFQQQQFQQQSWNHLFQERLQFNNARLPHEPQQQQQQFLGVQQQQHQQQPPPLLNALLMCLGSRERPQEGIPADNYQQIQEGRRQLESLLNPMTPTQGVEDKSKYKEQGGTPGEGEEKSDERFAGPSLGEGGLFSTGPVQSPGGLIDSSVYIPKYIPTRTNSTPDVRNIVDPSKFQFSPQFPSQTTLPPQHDAPLPNNAATTSPLYPLPPPRVLSDTVTHHSPPLPTATPPPFLASFPSSPYAEPPQSVVASQVRDVEQLPSLSKLLNFCTKTR